MTRIGSVVIAASLVAGCAEPTTAVAEEPAFEEPFFQVSDWHTTEVMPPNLPERSPALDPLLASLRNYLLAGVHAPRGDEGVTIIVPEGAQQATEVHLFIIVHGGANAVSVAHEFRAIARRDSRGWWLEDQMETRVYCDVPMRRAIC